MFCEMVENYISVINRGGVPNIATAYKKKIDWFILDGNI